MREAVENSIVRVSSKTFGYNFLSHLPITEMPRKKRVDTPVEDIVENGSEAPAGKTPRRESPAEGPQPEAKDQVTGSPAEAITKAEISDRAYELYERRGRQDGQHEGDWLEAERELRDR